MAAAAERKPTGLERMALNMLEGLLRSSLGKSPDELRAVFEVTTGNLNAAAAAIVTIGARLAAIDARLDAIERRHASLGLIIVADAADGRLANGDDRSAAVHSAVTDRPGGDGLAAGGAGGAGGADGAAS